MQAYTYLTADGMQCLASSVVGSVTIRPDTCCSNIGCADGYRLLNQAGEAFEGASSPECSAASQAGDFVVMRGCSPKTCDAYNFVLAGVTGDDRRSADKACQAGIVLSSVMTECDVKCEAGYAVDTGTIVCEKTPPNVAKNILHYNDAQGQEPTCTENACAAYTFGVGVQGDTSAGVVCTDGIILKTRAAGNTAGNTVGNTCGVTCADGYEYSGATRKAGTVLCPAFAEPSYGAGSQGLLVSALTPGRTAPDHRASLRRRAAQSAIRMHGFAGTVVQHQRAL